MAKLKAKGRMELMRFEKVCEVRSDSAIEWHRESIALMSDRTILSKRDVRFKPDQFSPKPRIHSYGWKVAGKVSPTVELERIQKAYESKGFTRILS